MFGGQGDKREPVKLKWKIKAVDGKIKRTVGPKKSSEEHVSKVRTIDSNWLICKVFFLGIFISPFLGIQCVLVLL